jgi:hypothetical protein
MVANFKGMREEVVLAEFKLLFPGICPKKCMDFLTTVNFLFEIRTPDVPHAGRNHY